MVVEAETLRWFQYIADGMLVTEVADVFAVSQPTVSRAIGRLEREVGVALLHKTGRVLRPTHAGTVFKHHVDSLMHELDDGLAAVAELLDPETGTVRLAFQQSFGARLVPGLIAGFRATHPGVRFDLPPSDDAQGSSLVAGGRVDLELTSRRPRNPEVLWRVLFSQTLYLAVHAEHRLAGRAELSLEEAADEDFVALRPSWELRKLSDDLAERAGFSPRVAFEADDLPTLRGFVHAGLGAAVVPADDASGPRTEEGIRLLRLTDPDASRRVGLAWSRERRLLPAADLFRRHVLSSFGAGQGPQTRSAQRTPHE